ncbi:deoxyribodipyrimidine photo-lyase [Leucothrix sargassi]|nr:deoxyribodipyrimidine photo-lyase [Leucothrix sargassi]
MSTAIFWFRQDLRLSDNPGLVAACEIYDQLFPIYIDDSEHLESNLGEASRVWLNQSLIALNEQLNDAGNELLLFKGKASDIIDEICQQLDIDAVIWNRCYEPEAIERDSKIKSALKEQGIQAQSENALLLYEPWQVLKKDDSPYRVFTPYWKQVALLGLQHQPYAAPNKIPAAPDVKLHNVSLESLGLVPDKPWPEAMLSYWQVGELAAQSALKDFLDRSGSVDYSDTRDLPAVSGTSRMSPHLHFGEISPRQIIWQTLQETPLSELDKGSETFIKEVVWREFAYYIMYHFPETQHEAMYPQFKEFPWLTDISENLEKWQKGQTGYPIIDAGMRELYATGWMHNRVRMIVASFLCKNLLINWQEGEAWFRDTLVDADLASNILGWQWSSGCGADASPYFRVFNPVTQSKKFDTQGEYIKRWVPELKDLDKKTIHEPWLASSVVRSRLDYPEPMVDLSATRQRALDSYAKVKKQQ